MQQCCKIQSLHLYWLMWPFALFSCYCTSLWKVLSLCLAEGHPGMPWINELAEPVKHLARCSVVDRGGTRPWNFLQHNTPYTRDLLKAPFPPLHLLILLFLLILIFYHHLEIPFPLFINCILQFRKSLNNNLQTYFPFHKLRVWCIFHV